MKTTATPKNNQRPHPKSEYSVQFECVSTYLAYFEDTSGLTDQQIVAKALEIAKTTFDQGSSLLVERMSTRGSYAIMAMGVDATTATVLGKPAFTKPQLKIVK